MMGLAARQAAHYLPILRFGELAWNAIGTQTDNNVAGNVRSLTGDYHRRLPAK